MIFFGSDYDHTLRHGSHVEQEDLEAIREFRRRGHRFGVVTGRGHDMIINMLRADGVPYDILICNNGGTAFTPDGRQLFAHLIPIEDFYPLLDYFHRNPLPLRYTLCNGRNIGMGIRDGRFFPKEEVEGATMTEADMLPDGRFSAFLAFYPTPGELLADTAFLREHFSHAFEVHISGVATVDICPKGVTKTAGILETKDLLGCDRIYTMGDSHNDLSMVEAFQGFAVENAVDEVKAAATRVFPRVRDALYYLLEQETAKI